VARNIGPMSISVGPGTVLQHEEKLTFVKVLNGHNRSDMTGSLQRPPH
jgi:hypothetical protein